MFTLLLRQDSLALSKLLAISIGISLSLSARLICISCFNIWHDCTTVVRCVSSTFFSFPSRPSIEFLAFAATSKPTKFPAISFWRTTFDPTHTVSLLTYPPPTFPLLLTNICDWISWLRCLPRFGQRNVKIEKRIKNKICRRKVYDTYCWQKLRRLRCPILNHWGII